MRDTHMRGRLDIPGLRRLEIRRHGLEVIEFKLGKNAELVSSRRRVGRPR